MSALHDDWERYKRERPRYVQAAEEVRLELVRIAESRHIPADVSARAKDTGEFVRKALRKPYAQPWLETDDKAGARAVVEREHQVDDLLAAIEADVALTVVPGSIDDKRHRKPGALEYGGVHLQVVAPHHQDDEHEYEVELQLRTKAQDLWSSVVSHRLLYKKAIELPDEVQHRLYNLLALMEMFDQEVTRVIKELPHLKGYKQEKLATAAETAYLAAHVREDWDTALSASLLRALEAAVDDLDVDGYVEDLAVFAREHEADLSALLSDYAGEASEGNPDYILFQQPEVVLIWERLSSAPARLMTAWAESRLPYELLTRTADVLGIPYEDA
jgi:ppGpp synthetase/RelA/SpoT-type nucleotidyltranferase